MITTLYTFDLIGCITQSEVDDMGFISLCNVFEENAWKAKRNSFACAEFDIPEGKFLACLANDSKTYYCALDERYWDLLKCHTRVIPISDCEQSIYYAHHQYKYGTREEEYEMDLIKRYFPNSRVFNPSAGLKTEGRTEEDIMRECLARVADSDIVVFSSISGVLGKGAYTEVEHARKAGKIVLYIYQDGLYSFDVQKIENPISDRLYATVTPIQKH